MGPRLAPDGSGLASARTRLRRGLGNVRCEMGVMQLGKVPFLQSRASGPLIAMTATIMAIGVLIPVTPVGRYLGFTPLPPLYWLVLALTLLAYMLLTQGVKSWLIRRAWM